MHRLCCSLYTVYTHTSCSLFEIWWRLSYQWSRPIRHTCRTVLATDESESVIEIQPVFSDGGTSDSYLNYYSHNLQSQKPTDLQKSKEMLSEKIAELQLLVSSCTNIEAIHFVSVHLSSALSIVKSADAYQFFSLIIRKQPSPNSNSQKQFRYHTTKKKQK